MTRTKLMDREMPVYTKNEELFNMISHIVGGAVGVAGLVLCIIVSALHHNGFGDRKSTRLNSSHSDRSRMPSSA